MKIKDRLDKLIEEGFITAEAVEAAQSKGWVTAAQRTTMVKKAEDKTIKNLNDKGLITGRK